MNQNFTFKRQLVLLGRQHEELSRATSVTQARESLEQLEVLENELREMEQSILDAVRSSGTADHADSVLATFLSQLRQTVAADGRRDMAKKQLDDYRDVLNVARSLRSIVGQVTIPQLEAFIIRKEQGTAPVMHRQYIRSKEWRQKAEEAKERAGHCCQVCNRSRDDIQLDAHHRTYERLGNELPEDITVLCRDCHQLYEDNKKVTASSRACAKCGETFAPLAVTHLFCNNCYAERRTRLKRRSGAIKAAAEGYCIRCKSQVTLDSQAPCCKSCYAVWKKYSNRTYQEKFCHVCGQTHPATMLKPVCYNCYKLMNDKLVHA